MNCPCNTTDSLPRLRAIRFGVLVAAIAALSLSAPASAETIEGAGAPPEVEVPAVPPGSDTGAVAATPAPAAAAPESVQVESVQAEPVRVEPAQLEELPSTPVPDVVTDSLRAVPTSDEEAGPGGSAVSATVERTLSRTETIANTTADVAIKAGEQAGVSPEALPSPIRRPGDLLDSAVSTSEEPAASVGSSPSAARAPASSPEPAQGGSALTWANPVLPPGPPTAEPLSARAAGSGVEKTFLPRDAARNSIRASGETIADAGALPSASGDARPTGSPTPPGVPLPTPESPVSAVPGSGGPSFIPFAALLALLALGAPATKRRFGRPPDSQVPTRFVCALERPG